MGDGLKRAFAAARRSRLQTVLGRCKHCFNEFADVYACEHKIGYCSEACYFADGGDACEHDHPEVVEHP